MTPPAALQAALADLLGDARLGVATLPDTDIRLWLIDADNMDRAFSPEETRRILDKPPYWCFCWASGLVLARWLAERPEWVRGKRVLDFGTGSGVAAIAAAKAGAAEVVACDLDPLALAACRANAELNGVQLSYSGDFFAEADRYDLIIVADVLYDRANLPLLDQFLSRGREALVADSRVRDFQHALYERLDILDACTWPDLAEPAEFRRVSLYHSVRRGDDKRVEQLEDRRLVAGSTVEAHQP
ncbi:methyltransferase [Pseudomonas stutzeri]|nr:50S ribosomal protein L11 methyltransferase [Stutzerimonas stutzeri]MBA1276730.1 methyltransferase [Stutzerimonas stutzeri]